ncbi:hypothetical protein [Mesorhizobium sp. IMUNJ 23232]|uniref:hypothetical protein n=1 Tax=Mesorhizobium sp. IMUNJ 23232 TaxID=3376064 RepID=UPI0037AC53C1
MMLLLLQREDFFAGAAVRSCRVATLFRVSMVAEESVDRADRDLRHRRQFPAAAEGYARLKAFRKLQNDNLAKALTEMDRAAGNGDVGVP